MNFFMNFQISWSKKFWFACPGAGGLLFIWIQKIWFVNHSCTVHENDVWWYNRINPVDTCFVTCVIFLKSHEIKFVFFVSSNNFKSVESPNIASYIKPNNASFNNPNKATNFLSNIDTYTYYYSNYCTYLETKQKFW